MRMQIYNIIERKNKSNLSFFLMAALLGVIIFMIALVIFKGGFFLIKFIIVSVRDYWLFMLGGIAAFLIGRRVLFRRRIKNAMYHQEM